MSATRTFSPGWALLLLPVALFIGWFAGGVPVPSKGSGAGAPAERENAITATRPSGERAPDGMPAEAGGTTAPDAPGRPPVIYSSWTTYDGAMHEAHANGKPILLDFNAEWCGPCQSLKREVFDNPAGAATVKAAVIPVSLTDRSREDGQNPAALAALQAQFKVDAFPTLVVYSPATGKVVRTQGFGNAAETLRWITEAALAVK